MGVECPHEMGFKCSSLSVVHKDAGATGTEDFWCCVEGGKDACTEQRAQEGKIIAGGEVDWGGGSGSLGGIGEMGQVQVIPVIMRNECCDELSGKGRLGRVWNDWPLLFATGNYLYTVAWHCT